MAPKLKKTGKTPAKAASVAKKASPKKATKKKAAPPKPKKAFAVVGDRRAFAGYAEKNDDPLFEVGEAVEVIDVAEQDAGKIYTCVKFAEAEAYKADPDSYDAEELVEAELKRGNGKVIEPPIEIVDVGDIGKLVKKGGLTDQVKAIILDVEQYQSHSYFSMGGLLAHVYYDGVYKDEGFTDERKGWDEYCEANFGFKGRKAKYFIDIYMSFSKMENFNEGMLKQIGWSKAAEVARYANEDNVEQLIEEAEDKPVVDLKAHFKENYEVTGNSRPTPTSTKIKKIAFSFRLFEDQAEGAKMILEQASKKLGLELDDTFEHILTEWAGDNLGDSAVKKAKSAGRKKLKELSGKGVDTSGREKAKAA